MANTTKQLLPRCADSAAMRLSLTRLHLVLRVMALAAIGMWFGLLYLIMRADREDLEQLRGEMLRRALTACGPTFIKLDVHASRYLPIDDHRRAP